MSLWRAVRRKARAAVPPTVFLLIATYFAWNATQGERGLHAYEERQGELIAAQAELARTEHDLVVWDRRIASLRNNRLDLDALDDRARAMLNLSDPNDLIILYGDGKKLF